MKSLIVLVVFIISVTPVLAVISNTSDIIVDGNSFHVKEGFDPVHGASNFYVNDELVCKSCEDIKTAIKIYVNLHSEKY